ncbi:MAG: AmmeMemoRadiSam system protein B [Candidatus Hydrogenedentes bacterium]|nr:AmmeMemoRadiSam system protein B [Candidatus Hydrogenedentota bacterium]
MREPSVRRPAVAGQFYPANPIDLERTVASYIEDAEVEPDPTRVISVIAPHAGYMYSGATAGHAFARARGKSPGRVILLGCSHRYAIETASVFTGEAFDTPLGRFPVDLSFAVGLAKRLDSQCEEAHVQEHALEVMLPFLKVAIGIVPIVPVLLGPMAVDWHTRVGEIIAEMADPGDFVVVSTDLSHYLSEEEANMTDRRSLDAVMSKDVPVFAKGVARKSVSMCGASAVLASMVYAREAKADAWRLLDYRTSAAASGDYSRVVGYAAMSMERSA